VTDPQNWQPPSSAAPEDRVSEQQYGPPGTPTSSAWAPPPKPGLIPLRPLAFGTLMFAPFQVLRRNPKATFGSALIVQAVVVFLTVIVMGLVAWWADTRISSAPLDEQGTVEAGATATLLLSALIPLALSVVGAALMQGVIVTEVARATLGEKLRLPRLVRLVAPRFPLLVLWTVVLSGGFLIAAAALIAIVVLLVALGGGLWLALGIVTAVVGGLALVAVGLWVFTRTSIVPSLIVLERLGVRAAVRRSWSLTRGYFWRTFGVQALISIIVGTITQIVTLPFVIGFTWLTSLVDPTAALDAYIPAIITYVALLCVTLVLSAIGTVLQSAAIALIYLDLRMRKEGLDLELARFVESSQTGVDLPDPYLVVLPVASDSAPASPAAPSAV